LAGRFYLLEKLNFLWTPDKHEPNDAAHLNATQDQVELWACEASNHDGANVVADYLGAHVINPEVAKVKTGCLLGST